MTATELFNKKPSEVRNNNELLTAFLKFYKKQFKTDYILNCCTFASDFNSLKSKLNLKNNFKNKIQMENSFTLLDNSEIYSYRAKDKPVARCYGYNMTEEFAIAYLANGTKEEIEIRKAEFKKLPETKKADDKKAPEAPALEKK